MRIFCAHALSTPGNVRIKNKLETLMHGRTVGRGVDVSRIKFRPHRFPNHQPSPLRATPSSFGMPYDGAPPNGISFSHALAAIEPKYALLVLL